MATRGFRVIQIHLKGSPISVYASARTADALTKIEKEMPLFDHVKLHQVLEAVYVQGTKDGARQTDRKSTRLNSSHIQKSRMPSSA